MANLYYTVAAGILASDRPLLIKLSPGNAASLRQYASSAEARQKKPLLRSGVPEATLARMPSIADIIGKALKRIDRSKSQSPASK